MEMTKGIVAIFLCSALLISPTHCIEDSFSVRNLRSEDVTSWGFKVLWDAPLGRTVDEYIVELWSGGVFVESQVIEDPTTREYVFEGLPKNTGFRVIVWSVETNGPNDEHRIYSLPEVYDVSTLDTQLELVSRDESSITYSVPAPDPPGSFSNYHVIYVDVDSQLSIMATIPSSTVNINQGNLDAISGSVKRGRLIEVTVREDSVNGDLVTNPARFRTILDRPSGFTIEDITSTSVTTRGTHGSDVDTFEYVATNADFGSTHEVTAEGVNSVDTLIDGLQEGEPYEIKLVVSVGERDRPDNFRPTYAEAESNSQMVRLVDLEFLDGQDALSAPNRLDVSWVWTPEADATGVRLRAINPQGVTTVASVDPLSTGATTAVLLGLQPGRQYNVELSYITNNGEEPITSEVHYTPLSPVTGFSIEHASQTSIAVVWDEVDLDIDFHYELFISPAPDEHWRPKNGRHKTTDLEYVFLGLSPGTTYSIGVQTRAEDPDEYGSYLSRSVFETMSAATALQGLTVSPSGGSSRAASVSWYNSIAPDSQFEVTLETYFEDDDLDAEISPSTQLTVPSSDDDVIFEGLQPGIIYEVTLREIDDNGDRNLLTSLEFKFLIDIFVTLNELNAKTSILQFNPADSIEYDNYLLQARAAAGSSDDCQKFAEDFGCVSVDEHGCGRYWTRKPASCEIEFDVTAYRDESVDVGVVSDPVILTANEDNPEAYTIYEGRPTDDSLSVWWLVDNNPSFDFYYLEVRDEDDNLVYCTAIPRPADQWLWWTIDGLNPGTCYTVRLEQWRYDEVDNDNNVLDNFDAEKQLFTSLGDGGQVSTLYVLTQTGNDLQLGWGLPTNGAISTSGYEVCIEPVDNPAAYQPEILDNDEQVLDILNAVDHDQNRYYIVEVTTFIEGDGKETQYSESRSDEIDLDAPFRGALTVINIGTTFLQLEWHRDEGFLPTTSNYRVTIFDEEEVQVGDPITVGPTSSTPITRTLNNLTPGTFYCIQVDWLNTVPEVYREVCKRTLPNQPGAISIIAVGLTDVAIEWDESTGNKDFYLIYATDLDNNGEAERKGRVDNDENSFVVEGLIPDTAYRIEVVAVSGTEAENTPSDPRSTVATTNAIDECDVIITALCKDWIEVRWGPCPDADVLQICPRPAPPDIGDPDFTDILDITDRDTGDERLYTFRGLRPSKKYSIFLKGGGERIDSITKYTEPEQPELTVTSRTPTTVTVAAEIVRDFPDDRHTIIYELYDPDGELLDTAETNGQDWQGQWIWSELEPDTDYVCRAFIIAGYDQRLQTPSDPLEEGVPCSTSVPLANKIYLEKCDESSFILAWGDLIGNSRYQINIDPPPIGSTPPYRFDITEDNSREIGGLEEGQLYEVTLLEGSGIDPDVVDRFIAFTKPSYVPFEVESADQTSIAIRWLWPYDEVIDYFAIDHKPVIPPRYVPEVVRFWNRDNKLECLLPGHEVTVKLFSLIEDDDRYFFSQPYERQLIPTDLPRSNLEVICVCFTDQSFTIAWSDWLAPSGFDFDGYVIDVYELDSGQLNEIDEIKVAPEDRELFHHFYNLGSEFNGIPYVIDPTHLYVVNVRIIGTDISAAKPILTRPRPPSNLRRAELSAPDDRISIKVEWDPPENSEVDYYKVYYNRFGYPEVYEDIVDPSESKLKYRIKGLDPLDPGEEVDLSDPEQRPAAYSIWVVAVYEATFIPPENDRRKKRQISENLEEVDIVVESEPSVLPHEDGLTEPMDPGEILAQVVGTRDILTLFGADPENADPEGKYRFFIDIAEVPDPFYPFEARGGTLDVADAEYFFDYTFEDLIPGTVFVITLSVELEDPVDDENDARTSIEVLTCPEPPPSIEQTGGDAVSLTFSWPEPFGQYTFFEAVLERIGEDGEDPEEVDRGIVSKPEITFDKLFPDTEYTVSVRTIRIAKPDGDPKTKRSEFISLTTETADLSPLQIAIQDFGTNFIDIVFGETIQNVVYEISIDPGNCPYGWAEYDDFCYYFAHTERVDYLEAQSHCREYYSELVSIHSQDEQDFLAGCAENDPDTADFGYWIGLNDRASEGTFVYDDQSPVDFDNWADNEPDSNVGLGGNEDCVTFWQTQGLLNDWGDIDCATEHAYICKQPKARPEVSYPVQQTVSLSHQFTALVPGRCYTITVDANEYNARAETQRTNPLPVDGLETEDVFPTSVCLSWETPLGVHDGFYVSYKQKYGDEDEEPTHYPFKLLQGTEQLCLDDLVPDTEYVLNVVTVASYGDCDELHSEPEELEFQTLPLESGHAYIQDVTFDSISLEWGTPVNTFSLEGYQIFLCPDSCNDPVVFGPDKTKYTFNSLVPGREYAIIFQVLRTDDDDDSEQLLLQRTLPLPVPSESFAAESLKDSVVFSWGPPPGGEFDQYKLTYSISYPHHPETAHLEYKYLNKETTEYTVYGFPGSVVFASIQSVSQVECTSQRALSDPVLIDGVESDGLLPLEIFILERHPDGLLLTWGKVEDLGAVQVLYTLSWFREIDESDREVRVTKNNKWLIKGLAPGDSYYIKVEYSNLESRNKGWFSTALYPPAGIEAEDVGTTSAEITWEEDNTDLTEYYVVYHGPVSCAERELIYLDADEDTEVELEYLEPSLPYRARVLGLGGDTYSSEATETFTTDSIPFGECEVVKVYNTSVVVAWDSVIDPVPAPAVDERYDVYKYERYIRVAETEEVHGEEEFGPSDHPYVKFENLWPGRQYEVCCKVYQINVEEELETCELQVTAPEPPSSIAVRDEHLRGFCVDWDGPGTNFDYYVIKVLDEEGERVYPPDEEATVPLEDPEYLTIDPEYTYHCFDDLLPGVTYTVRLGTWVEGEPEPQRSEALSEEATTETLDPLEILVETQEKDSLVIQWGEIDDPNVENPEYIVTWYKEGSDSEVTIPTHNTRYPINGLEPGTGYYFKVEYGEDESPNTGVFYTVPCPPEDLVDINTPDFPRSGTRFSLKWDPPSDGGYDGFRISYVDPDGDPDEKIKAGVVDRDTTRFTVVGLYVDQEYTFCVQTIVGEENWDTASEPETLDGKTLALDPLEIEISQRDTNSFLVGWGAIDNPDNGETHYIVTAETDSGATAAIDIVPVDERTVSLLTPVNSGIKYNIHIRIGEQESDVFCLYSLPEPPGEIYLIQATSSTLDIGWGPAENFVGEYEITYTPTVVGAEQPVRTSPQDRRLFLEGLNPNTEYEFTIVNTVGEDEFKTDSEPVQEAFATRNARLSVVGEPTTNTITVQWTPEVGEFDEYLVRVIDTEQEYSQEILSPKAPTNELTEQISNLIPGTLYRLELYTVDDDEEQLSDIEEAITFPAPPENLQLTTSTFSSLSLQWDAPLVGRWDGFEVTYDYSVQDQSGDAIGRTPSPTNILDTEIALEGLLPSREFQVHVRSFRRFGDVTKYSDDIEDVYSTLDAPEGSLIVRSVSETTIGVRWTSITGADRGYNLQLINVNGIDTRTYTDPFLGNEALLEDLVPGAVYDIQLTAIGIDGGDNQYQATIPPEVTALTRVQRSIDSITLGWDALSGGPEGEATGFIVSYYPRPDNVPPYQEIPNPGDENAEVLFTLDNLLTDQEYEFSIVTYTEFTGVDGIVRRELSDEFEYTVRTPDLNPAQLQILDINKDYVCVKWGGTENGAATEYELRIIEVDNITTSYQAVTVPINTGNLEKCFVDLHPGTLYELEVRVLGTLEAGTERFRTKACAPPNLREVISYQCSVTIAWDPADGQADAYRLFYRNPNNGGEPELLDVIFAGQPLEYTLEDLEPETGYEFRVETVAGGELQEISEDAVIVVFTDIELLIVEQTDNSLSVSWDAVDADFILYEIHHGPDDGDLPSSVFITRTGQRLVELSGLTTGRQYTLVLNIVSDEGEKSRIARTCFTLQPPPIPNQSITATAVDDEPQTILITFDSPDLVNSIIDFLRIVATPGDQGAGAGNPTELEYIIPFEACPEIRLTGLCPDTYYVITLYTMSGQTLSEPVTTSITTPPADKGEISFGESTPTSIEIFWADGADTDYTIRIAYLTPLGTMQVKEQLDVPQSDARTYIFRDLTPGTLYTVTVSETGSSDYLDRKSLRTRPIDLLGDLIVTHVYHNSVTLSWPAAVGVDGYQVCYFDVADGVSRSYDVDIAYTESSIENLLPETTYVFSVASFEGEGADRSISEKLTITALTDEDPTVPAPRNLFVNSFGPHDVTLQWEEPLRDNYDHFLVEYLPDDVGHPSSPVLLPGNQFSLDISELVSDTNYIFVVHAVSGRAGLSEVRSEPASVHATTASLPFVIETLQVTDTRIDLTWGPHSSDSLVSYEVTYDPADGFVSDSIVSNNELRAASLHSLHPDTYYEVRVHAKNAVGEVLNVATATVKTLKLPVRSLKSRDETTSSVFLYWPPAVDQLPSGHQLIDDSVEGYHVYIQGYSDYRGPGALADYKFVSQSACPSITLRGLYPGQKYYVSVIAVDVNDNAVTSPASVVIETLPHEHLDLHTVYVDSNTIEVAWSPASGDFSNYLLQYNPPGGTNNFNIFSKADERRLEIQGLLPGQLYAIQLTVQSIDNIELYSTTIYQHTIPSSPTDLVFSRITDTGFIATWPPVVVGRSSYYGLCIYPDPQDINVAEVYSTNYPLEDLYPSTNYLVSVFSEVEDEYGNEAWSEPISDYQETTVGEPGVPIVVDYDETTVQVSWVRVEGTTRYYVRRTKTDGTDLTTDVSQSTVGLTVDYIFEDLDPGYEYFFYVRPDSVQFQEEVTRQRTKPLSPLFVRTEYNAEDPSQRTVTWQPPGAGHVDRYEITYTPSNGSPPSPIYIDASGPLEKTITGLNSESNYVFIVTSEAGIGNEDIRTRSKPAVADIDVVIRLAVENYGHYSIDVAWPELPGEFDSYVISYEPYDEFKPNVRPSPVEIGRQYDITSLNIYGLVPGQEYTIYLQTKTGRDLSPVIQHVTQTTVPLSVEEVRIDLVTASSFHFSWDDAEGVKDTYQVIFEPVADVNNPAPALGSLPRETLHSATGGLTTVEVTDLEAAQEYQITVVTWSNDQYSYGTTVIAATRPFPPSFVEVQRTTTDSAEVHWYDGEFGNLGISKYQIEVIPRDSSRPVEIDADSGRNTHVIPGLTSGRPYQALIQSIVIDSNGEYLESLPVSVAFVTVPLPPIFKYEPEITSNSIQISWASGGGDLTRYSVEYFPVPTNPSVLSPITVTPRSHLELTVSGLSASTEYTFIVKAITSVTVSDSQTGTFEVIKESSTNTVFHTTLPNAVPEFYVTSSTATSVGLAWSAPEGPVDQYRIQVYYNSEPHNPITISPTGPLEYTVTGLHPDADYTFEIVNVVGGQRSSPNSVSASTNEDISGPPDNLSFERLSPNSIRVEWNPPDSPNGDLQGYLLVISSHNLASPTEVEREEIELSVNDLEYVFENLRVGYAYTFSIAAVNNVGTGHALPLGQFLPFPETAPLATGERPYRTPNTDDKDAYSISITFSSDFFRDIYGPVANYSVLVVEEPNPREPISRQRLGEVEDPPPNYQSIQEFNAWPGYQASPRGYNPFIQRFTKRQAGVPGQGPIIQTEFVIGKEEDCPNDPRYYCNGRLRPYTYYRVAIRAYGVDGTYSDTPWSEPFSTGFNVFWFVYALVGLCGFIVLIFFIILCVCCGGCGSPGEMDFFEDSEEDKKILMMKQMGNGTPPLDYRRPITTDYTSHYRPPAFHQPSEKAYPQPKRNPPPPKSESNAYTDFKPRQPTKPRVYGTPTSQWSK